MINFPLKLVREFILIRQLFESFVIFAFFNILRSYITDQRSDRVNIICQAHHTENFNNNQAQSFLICRSSDVSKAYRKHDSCSPIVSPSVSLEPVCILNTFYSQPTHIILIYVAHRA